MPTSYPAYSATIRPDGRLRVVVLASGVALIAAGALAILFLPAAPALGPVLAVAWIALGASKLVRVRRQMASVRAYRVYADGSLDLIYTAGARAGRLLPGSMLYERVGWLRVASADSAGWAELVAGNCRKNKEWRRLQVIFRHRSA